MSSKQHVIRANLLYGDLMQCIIKDPLKKNLLCYSRKVSYKVAHVAHTLLCYLGCFNRPLSLCIQNESQQGRTETDVHTGGGPHTAQLAQFAEHCSTRTLSSAVALQSNRWPIKASKLQKEARRLMIKTCPPVCLHAIPLACHKQFQQVSYYLFEEGFFLTKYKYPFKYYSNTSKLANFGAQEITEIANLGA